MVSEEHGIDHEGVYRGNYFPQLKRIAVYYNEMQGKRYQNQGLNSLIMRYFKRYEVANSKNSLP